MTSETARRECLAESGGGGTTLAGAGSAASELPCVAGMVSGAPGSRTLSAVSMWAGNKSASKILATRRALNSAASSKC